MTDAKREDKLNPAQSGRSDLPPGKLRSISMDEIDLLQVDRNGRLYWDGKPVEVSRRLTFWQSVGAFIVGTFIVIGSVGSFLQGWTVYHDLACRMGWYTFAVTCVPIGALTPELSWVFSQCLGLGSKKSSMKRRGSPEAASAC
jgi:hypothetical protein